MNIGCDNCHKLYFELTAKIKELEKENRKLVDVAAQAVGNVYANKILSDKRVAYCEKCHKFLSEDLIDKKTGCCEGGCK